MKSSTFTLGLVALAAGVGGVACVAHIGLSYLGQSPNPGMLAVTTAAMVALGLVGLYLFATWLDMREETRRMRNHQRADVAPSELRRVCAWCGVIDDADKMRHDSAAAITHGICPDCARKVLKEARQ